MARRTNGTILFFPRNQFQSSLAQLKSLSLQKSAGQRPSLPQRHLLAAFVRGWEGVDSTYSVSRKSHRTQGWDVFFSFSIRKPLCEWCCVFSLNFHWVCVCVCVQRLRVVSAAGRTLQPPAAPLLLLILVLNLKVSCFYPIEVGITAVLPTIAHIHYPIAHYNITTTSCVGASSFYHY